MKDSERWAADRRRMLALTRTAHAGQWRNNGRVPYWMHTESVAQILETALQRSGELAPDNPLARDLYLAAQGHDLYEDTTVDRAEIRHDFGERVDALIEGMTNHGGDADRAAYVAHMVTAPEEVRVIKLADMVENAASCSYGIVDLGVAWTQDFLLPILREMRAAVGRTTFDRFTRTARILTELADFHLERLERNLEMFRQLDREKTTR